VLVNDTDPDPGDTRAVTELNGSATLTGTSVDGAAVTIRANGSYSYNPGSIYQGLNTGEEDTDSFSYTIRDAAGAESTANVIITIEGVTEGAPRPLPADWHKGATVTSWWHDDYERPQSDEAIAALAGTGSTHAAILTTWYMSSRTSSRIAPDAQKTPSDAAILRAIAQAKAAGMRVSLKPHVDVWDGTFRANIAPSSRTTWFTDYRAMMNHYADLARTGGADMLVVGTELTSMSSHNINWRRVIDEVRARFGGELTFAANWIDGAKRVAFWDALDYIGIDAYMPLASGDPNPSVDALVAAWHERCYVADIAALQARYEKPVIFTELGYQSRYGTATTPWGGASGSPAQEPQDRAYEAAYRVWSQVPWFKGIWWWDWRAFGSVDPGDGDYSPRGKRAESTMRRWNGGHAEASPTPANACF
jgi:VCBS repeat-containing protein